MLGLVIFAMLIGYNVFKHNSNPVELMTEYAPMLYNFHYYTTIFVQILLAICTLICFIIVLLEDDKDDRNHFLEILIHLFFEGISALIGGLAAIMASSILIRATANHPTELSQINLNEAFTVIILYGVVAWQTIVQMNRKFPKKKS